MLDTIDKRILRALQRDSSQTNAELAEQAGLSATPCSRRIQLLKQRGVIAGYTALVNPAKVGLGFMAFVRITLDRQDKTTVEHFAREMEAAPEVLECYLMAGGYDYLLRVYARDLDDYQRFQMETLTRIEGVRNVVTEIPLKGIKQTNRLPI